MTSNFPSLFYFCKNLTFIVCLILNINLFLHLSGLLYYTLFSLSLLSTQDLMALYLEYLLRLFYFQSKIFLSLLNKRKNKTKPYNNSNKSTYGLLTTTVWKTYILIFSFFNQKDGEGDKKMIN